MAELQQLVDAAAVEFHGVSYSISIAVQGDELLVVELEEADSAAAWRGEFGAKYVEDIAAKTGSFKRFPVFVRMLLSAVAAGCDSVFLDLLTYADLELLKAKKAAAAAAAGDAGAAAAVAASAAPLAPVRTLPAGGSAKRYLILTYASEFERVHYPLPLLPDEAPDPGRLRGAIASLRRQLADARAQHAAPAPAASRDWQRGGGGGSGSGRCGHQACAADIALLSSRLDVAAAELEAARAAHRRELRKKARELAEAQEELSRSRDVTRELRLRLKALEAELQAARQQRSTDSSSAGGAAALGRGSGPRRPAAADRYMYGPPLGYLSSSGGGSSKYPSRPPRDAAGSYAGRGSSRGSSPASSRVPSPSSSLARPRAQASTPPRPPRPSSAPPRQRFDPTAYVRQKREREAAAALARSSSLGGGSSRGSSPARSTRSSASMRSAGGAGSGASTPRSAGGASSAPASPCSSCPPPGHRSERRLASSGGRGGLQERSSGSRAPGGERQLWQQHGSASPARPDSGGSGSWPAPGLAASRSGSRQRLDSNSPARLRAVYGASLPEPGRHSRSSSRQQARAAGSPGLHRAPSGRDGPGAASPGRALQGVRDRLSAYHAKQAALQAQGSLQVLQAQPPPGGQLAVAAAHAAAAAAAAGTPPPAPCAPAAAAGRVLQDAGSEIADIDARLQSLQAFLARAKSSVAAG